MTLPRRGFVAPRTRSLRHRIRAQSALVLLTVSCGGAATPPRGPAPSSAPASDPGPDPSTGPSPARTAEAPTAQAPSAPADPCNITFALGAAHPTLAPGSDAGAWLDSARARLIAGDDAERAFTGVAQAVLSALSHRRYDKLAGLTAPEGLCLRVRADSPCQLLTVRDVASCAALPRSRTFTSGRTDEGSVSCTKLLKDVFYDRDYLRQSQVAFNCFPAPDAARVSVIRSGPAIGYVELRHAPDDPSSPRQSLWMVFAGNPDDPHLIELVRE